MFLDCCLCMGSDTVVVRHVNSFVTYFKRGNPKLSDFVLEVNTVYFIDARYITSLATQQSVK